MNRFLRLAAALSVVISTAHAQTPSSRPVRQDRPCTDQPKSIKELRDSFSKGRVPSTTELTGSWVSIGIYFYESEKRRPSLPSLNCAGLPRDGKFEFVLIADRYAVELIAIGISYPQTVNLKLDHKGSLEFPVDFNGDRTPIYRCRLTERKTLACLVDEYGEAWEFKKMPVEEGQIPRPEPDH